MKYIINFILISVLLFSCKKEEITVHDMKISPKDITKIELRGDHKTLIPNGRAKMEFRVVVSATKEVTGYIRHPDGKHETVVKKEEFIVPSDQVPEGLIKVYDESGAELKNNIYSTTTDRPGTVKNFYAAFEGLKSNVLPITIRELPDESMEELVIPVVFHVISLPASGGPTYDVSYDFLVSKLNNVSDIFNGKITTDPNGGNAKIKFRLAEYNPAGIKMQDVGRTSYTLTAAETKTILDATSSTTRLNAYKSVIMNRKSTIMFDPARYFNVWLIKFSTATGISESYKFLPPSIMHSDYDFSSIPGIKFTKSADTFKLSDVTDCLQAGIIVNFTPFFNPSVQGQNEFHFATPIAGHFGLLETKCDKYNLLNPDGDSDYCPDTYSYDYVYYPQVYKANNLNGQPEDCPERPMEYFTSFNILDRYSRKSSISADQAKRMRMVLKQCPQHYAYKSNFAFTGKN